MITTAILSLVGVLIGAVAVVLPSGLTLSGAFVSSFSWLVQETWHWNYMFPIDIMWLQISLAVPIFVAWFAWSGLQWVISLVRGN